MKFINKTEIRRFNHLLQQGQTVVEYTLLLLVVIIIAYTMGQKIKDYFLADKGNCNSSSTSLICQFEKIYSDETFRYFVIKK